MCDKWILSEQDWNLHYLKHIENPSLMPMRFDPLIHSGILATPGYCPFCLATKDISPSQRMYQYLNRAKWLLHIQKHIIDLDKKKQQDPSLVLQCSYPEPRYPPSFDSILKLQFHIDDVHRIPTIQSTHTGKRTCPEDKEAYSAKLKRQRSVGKTTTTFTFINTSVSLIVVQIKEVLNILPSHLWKGSLSGEEVLLPSPRTMHYSAVTELNHEFRNILNPDSPSEDIASIVDLNQEKYELSPLGRAIPIEEQEDLDHVKVPFENVHMKLPAPPTPTAVLQRPSWDYVVIAGNRIAQRQ
jgi:hypothetical protein